MTDIKDRLEALEKTKAVRGLILGGKIGGAFTGIGGGIAILVLWLSWSVSFANSPNGDFILPGTFALLCVAGLQIHHSKAPILAAPAIMLIFVMLSMISFGMCVGFFIEGTFGPANAKVVDTTADKDGKTTKETDEQIAKSKHSMEKLKEHKHSVASFHFVVSMLALFVAAHGFFARLWLIENAIIDTQLRLISLSKRCLEASHTTNATLQALCLSASDQDQEKFKEIAATADQTEQALEAFSEELAKDFPAVGFRKGVTLGFEKRNS